MQTTERGRTVQNETVREWYALLGDASERAMIRLSGETEVYIAYLLTHYVNRIDLGHGVHAEAFLRAYERKGRARQDSLRDAGDQCLLCAGLFPNRAERLNISPAYVIRIGQEAYRTISEDPTCALRDFFRELSVSFLPAVRVLRKARGIWEHRVLM